MGLMDEEKFELVLERIAGALEEIVCELVEANAAIEKANEAAQARHQVLLASENKRLEETTKMADAMDEYRKYFEHLNRGMNALQLQLDEVKKKEPS